MNEERYEFNADLSALENWHNGLAFGSMGMTSQMIAMFGEHGTCRCGLPIWRLKPVNSVISPFHRSAGRDAHKDFTDGRWRHGTGNLLDENWPSLGCNAANWEVDADREPFPASWKARPAGRS